MAAIWKAFLKQVALSAIALSSIAALCAYLFTMRSGSVFSGFRLDLALLAIALMGLNALGAVGPLIRNQAKSKLTAAASNPMRVYMLSLMVRMAAVGIFTVVLVLQPGFNAAQAFSFVFTAMMAFAVFTVVEVRHLIRHQDALFSPQLKTP